MKKVFLLLLTTLLSTGLYAQTEGIKFLDNPLWKDVLAIAAKENKLIFIDCYTTWCGPCKALAKKTFPDKELGDFMNSRFINVKMDMEKGDGIELNKSYKKFIPGFPTMLLINSKGEVVHRAVGFMKPEQLIKSMENGLNGKTVASMKAKYEQGERSIAFIKEYLELLNSEFMRDEMAALVNEYIKSFPLERLKEKEIIELYIPYLKDAYSAQYEYVIKNMSHYNYRMKENTDRHAINEQVNRVMEYAIRDIVSYRANSEEKYDPLDPAVEKIAKLRSFLQTFSFRDRQLYNSRLILHELNVSGNYTKSLDLLIAACDLNIFGVSEATILVEYTNFYLNNATDKKIFEKLLISLEEKAKLIDPKKQNEEFNFYSALYKTYEKVGNKKLATHYKTISETGRNLMYEKYKEMMKQ